MQTVKIQAQKHSASENHLQNTLMLILRGDTSRALGGNLNHFASAVELIHIQTTKYKKKTKYINVYFLNEKCEVT